MDFNNIGAVASIGAALFLFLRNKKAKEEKPITSTQELINYKDISPDGIVELPNHQYRMVLEVEPVNMMLKSIEEQKALWVGFRDLINALTIPATFLVQTRHLDLKDYIADLRASVLKQSPQLLNYGQDLCRFLSEKTEKNVRDRRHYIILKLDAQAVSSIDSGIKIESESLNALMNDLSPKKGKMSNKELRAFAHQELENMAAVLHGCLSGMEISSIRLNKLGVLELIYTTLNRDMSPYARLVDANDQEMFSLVTQSITPFIGGVEDTKPTEQAEESERPAS